MAAIVAFFRLFALNRLRKAGTPSRCGSGGVSGRMLVKFWFSFRFPGSSFGDGPVSWLCAGTADPVTLHKQTGSAHCRGLASFPFGNVQENGDEEIGSIDFLGYALMIILLIPGSSGLLLCVWPNCCPTFGPGGGRI